MENKEKKICFVHIGMQRDGAERVIAKLANRYAEDGYKVDIIILLVEGCGYQLHKNVRIVSLVRNNYSRVGNLTYWIQSIRNHIKITNPKHVISFSMYVNIITLIACIGLGKDILISERNDPSSDGRSKFDIALTYALYGLANKVVFQTKRAQNCFPKYIRAKSRVIYNPVEISTVAKHRALTRKKIVTVGRLEAQKNQIMLIEAMSDVIKEYPNCCLEIYGEGTLRSKLMKLIIELDLRENVKLLGNVVNIHERIADSDIFVLPSNYEGMSNALLEALMMGLPCISTNCAGSDEIILNQDNGILVPIGNRHAMAEAIILLLNNDELSKRLGINAKKKSKIFSSELVLQKWLEYIES